jgi:hypothetical protein
MRRLVFLICAVVLMLDLADDGCLGKVKLVAPTHAAGYSVASTAHGSGKVDSQVDLPPLNWQVLTSQFPDQPVLIRGIHCHRKCNFSLFGSSGGIPL